MDVLAEIPDRRPSEALAIRALADLAPEVREAAVRALRRRPVEDYLDKAVLGLKYSWTPVADHAAELLVNLEAREAIPRIARLLNEPDPAAPRPVPQARGRLYAVQELARVNHLRNCVLCHAPSLDRGDLVRGAVPTPGQSLPAPVTTPQYYDNGQNFVRADITYLRQDFSVVQTVPAPGAWPANQRYDYLVRLRLVSAGEADRLNRALEAKGPSGQKQAMLFALRELTGKDLGTNPEAWKALAGERPEAAAEDRSAEAARLAQDLVSLPTERQEPLLNKLRDGKGTAFTNALAGAVPKLQGVARDKAREALVERLARMTAGTLRDKLGDESPEVRRAAALASASKEDQALIPDLIAVLEDTDLGVAHAAQAALIELTGQDLGVRLGRSAADQKAAADRWKEWWKKRSGR